MAPLHLRRPWQRMGIGIDGVLLLPDNCVQSAWSACATVPCPRVDEACLLLLCSLSGTLDPWCALTRPHTLTLLPAAVLCCASALSL